MALKIKFEKYGDKTVYNPQRPTFVLMTRSGKKLGIIPASSEVVKSCLNAADEVSFHVKKSLNETDASTEIWDSLTDFKLLWCKEWNQLFEMYVEVDEGDGLTKYVTCKALGEAETGQIVLHNIEINTETDIERDDYEITVLYDPNNPKASLLDRIMEKAPHYHIAYVSPSIRNIQRTFQFDNRSLYDAFQEIAEEIGCLFKINCYLDSNLDIVREIRVFDLSGYCHDCGTRGNFSDVCSNCGSTNVTNGYGEDTTIYVSVDNLTDEIRYSTDNGSVKNCFRLVAGDDQMTAAIRAINPNGTDYLWYITDEVKEDMSDALSGRIDSYNDLYDYYNDEYSLNISSVATAYNTLITKYSTYTSDYAPLSSPLVGYPAINEAYYNVIDFYYYLNDGLMPTTSLPETTASAEAAKLTVANLSPVAVPNLQATSSATAENAVLGMAKVIIDGRYQIKANTTSYTNNVWRGNFTVTNYADDTDTATSSTINVTVNGDYATYLQQKIDKAINKKMLADDIVADSVSLFKLTLQNFKNELKKYSLSMLRIFRDECQTCLDVLVEQGIANEDSWASQQNNLYDNMYVPYLNKLAAIDAEMAVRSGELDTIIAAHDAIENGIEAVHDALDFQSYIGDSLWGEFASYRREDTYQNNNYTSDGLTNAEIIERAVEFFNVAKEEIYKSATLQHSITSTLQNLLVMEEFQPIVDYFETGNWIHVRIDGKIYRLRLVDYEVTFDDLTNISVTFSDVTQTLNGLNDVQSILKSASSMATSYGAVTRQARRGSNGNDQLENWVEKGLALTNMKIVSTADDQNITWDDHGLLAREYDDILDSYSDRQLKIINQGLYVTDDGWTTSKAGIGAFTFWNPATQQTEERYGVIADTLVGSVILGQQVGVYNPTGSISLDEDGLAINGTLNSVSINPNATYMVDVKKGTNHLLYLDANGNLNITGNITATSLTLDGSASISATDVSGLAAVATSGSASDLSGLARVATTGAAGDVSGLAAVATTGSYSSLSGRPTELVYIRSDGTIGTGTVASGSNGFEITSAGLLKASNAIIFGEIYASAGTIGGFTLETNSIHTANVAITSNATNSVGLSSSTFTRTIGGTSRSNLKFAIGSKFGVANDGTLYAASGIFSGTISSTDGTIAGWKINTDSLSNGSTIRLYSGNTFEEKHWVSLISGREFELSYVPTLQSGMATITDDGDFLVNNIYLESNIKGMMGAKITLTGDDLYDKIVLDGGSGEITTRGNVYIDRANGTAGSNAWSYLFVGNNKAKTTAGHSTGVIHLYGYQSYAVELYPVDTMTANRYIRIPNADGTIALTSQAVSNITRSGNTFTATKADGSTFTFTQTDTTYGNATTSTAGLMSAADKTKLNAMTPYITGYSTSGNWKRILFSNNIQILWCSQTVSRDITTAWGYGYEGRIGYWTFPWAFSSTPTVTASVQTCSAGVILEHTGSASTTGTQTYYAYRATSASGVSITMGIIAIGTAA